MSYINRLDNAFKNAPVLPITANSKYVFFSDCHRGVGNNNDNFLKNTPCYTAALSYYYQWGFCYIEVGDGDELWENKDIAQIIEIHHDTFLLLYNFYRAKRLYMLYGNHDFEKKNYWHNCKSTHKYNNCLCPHMKQIEDFFYCLTFYESIILSSPNPAVNLYVTHGHQADLYNSVFWKLSRFMVRHFWTPLEYFGVSDPTSAAKNNTKRNKTEKRLLQYANDLNCHILTGHTHRPALGDDGSVYYNCGSCIHPKCITCIELCGYTMNLVKWYVSIENSEHRYNFYNQCSPEYPVLIKKEILATKKL